MKCKQRDAWDVPITKQQQDKILIHNSKRPPEGNQQSITQESTCVVSSRAHIMQAIMHKALL